MRHESGLEASRCRVGVAIFCLAFAASGEVFAQTAGPEVESAEPGEGAERERGLSEPAAREPAAPTEPAAPDRVEPARHDEAAEGAREDAGGVDTSFSQRIVTIREAVGELREAAKRAEADAWIEQAETALRFAGRHREDEPSAARRALAIAEAAYAVAGRRVALRDARIARDEARLRVGELRARLEAAQEAERVAGLEQERQERMAADETSPAVPEAPADSEEPAEGSDSSEESP